MPQEFDPRAYTGISNRLLRWRLPSYLSLLQGSAQVATNYIDTLKLFVDVFGYLPEQRESVISIQINLIEQIDEMLFPLDMSIASHLIMDGEILVKSEAIIIVRGRGIAWNYDSWDSLPASTQLMLFALSNELDLDHISDEEHELIELFWERNGYAVSQDLLFAQLHQDQILEQLGDLPEPLNGLRTLYQTLQCNTGNPFLDWSVSTNWHHIADGQGVEWHWNKYDIAELEALYAEALPGIEALDAYEDWFLCTPNAEAIALQHLICLGEPYDD